MGGGLILGSVFWTLILLGCWIFIVLELVGGKFISPITWLVTCSGDRLLEW